MILRFTIHGIEPVSDEAKGLGSRVEGNLEMTSFLSDGISIHPEEFPGFKRTMLGAFSGALDNAFKSIMAEQAQEEVGADARH